MPDDATLSDFGSTDGDGDRTTGDSSRDGGEPSDDPGGGSIGAVRSTYAWGDYACTRCGCPTERVWRADGDLVCPDCKQW
ncbi:DUF7573 domain-containing protein [Natrinema ejinorense]|uniref:DUF7573 domain-containing protein n=1 Tax=Natrinema ejinorense TaxID=373386 RepID=A0A2A5QXA3_9EURY|nr:hypothetical protein [Natrinema ejinorense]PCR91460.1 hypothetical protein CP557_13540 [Natrinema ejinorense]